MTGLKDVVSQALKLTRKTSDAKVRAALLDLVTKCASQVPAEDQAQRRLDEALREFNARQMFGSQASREALELDGLLDEHTAVPK
jgi:hypothetical protein